MPMPADDAANPPANVPAERNSPPGPRPASASDMSAIITAHGTPAPLPQEPLPFGTLVQSGQPAFHTATPLPEIPGYEVQGEIARGGMGRILAAHDPTLGRDVAIKVLLPESDTEDAVRRFVVESKITAQLPHPAIPPVHALGTLPDGSPFLVMKLIRGRTLADELEQADRVAELPRFVQIFEQIAQAVGFAHSQGVIHRDIKLANVMVGAFGEVQVMDWGLAKFVGRPEQAESGPSIGTGRPTTRGTRPSASTARELASPAAFGETKVFAFPLEIVGGSSPADDVQAVTATKAVQPVQGDPLNAGNLAGLDPGSADHTETGYVLGTPAYMAPEQARGEVLGPRADVFTLGGILCDILTGRPTFLGETVHDTLQLAGEGDVSVAFARLDSCGADAELISLAKRLLSPNAEDRPADGKAVADEVAAYRAGVEERLRLAETRRVAAEAKAAEEANTRRETEARILEQRKKRRVQMMLACAGAVIVGLIALGAWWQDRKAEEARFKAEQTRERAVNLLRSAEDARKEYRYSAAESALKDAGELVEQFELAIGPDVQQAKADLAFVVDLDKVRMKRSVWISDGEGRGRFDESKAPGEYRAAFLARGLDVVANPDAVSRVVAASAVRTELVTALDDWLVLETDGAVRNKVLVVLRQADGTSGAAPFRDPAVWKDKAKLESLAAKADVARMSPGAVVAIAELMRFQRLDAAPLLRHAMSLHPRDFHLAFSLGRVLHTNDNRDLEKLGAYRAARAIRPDIVILLNNLGVVLHESGDIAGSIATHREAIRLDPQFALAHSNLGIALRDSGDLPGAIAACREAIRLEPKNAAAHSNLGLVLRDSGDLPGAIVAYRDAIRLDRNDAIAHSNLGLVLRDSGDLPRAIAACKEAVRLDPNFALARNNLGVVLKDSGDLPGAIEAWKEALRLDPTLAKAHSNLGIALCDQGDFPGAIAACKEAIRHAPKYAEAYSSLGVALQASGDLAAAIRAYREAIRLNPKLALVHSNLGVALKNSGDLPGAIAACKEAIRLEPKLARAHSNLGIALDASGDLLGAIAAYREAIRLDPKYAIAHFNLGVVLQAKGDLDEAILAYQEAIRYEAKNAAIHTNLSVVYFQKKRYADAIPPAREAIRLNPKYANAHAALGMALRSSGDIATGRAAYAEAVRLDPKKFEPLFRKLFPPE